MYLEFIKELHAGTNELIEIALGSEKSFKRKRYTLDQAMKLKIPQDVNAYVGMFSKTSDNGKAISSGTTNSIWLDFDPETVEGVKQKISVEDVKLKLIAANAPYASKIIHSGNGIHVYYKLDKRVGTDVLNIIKGLAKATGADPKATLDTQIMRIPGTNNVKDAVKPCKVLENSNLTYSIKDFEKFIEEPIRASDVILNDNIPMFNMPCVDNMLKGVGKGERNFSLGRITKKLQQEGYTKKVALKEVLSFNGRCKPPKSEREVEQDFNAYWDKDYKLLGCTILDTRLQSILSNYCERDNCRNSSTRLNIDLDHSIGFNNRTVFEHYKNFTGHQLIVLGLLLKYPEGLNREQLEGCLYSPGLKKYVMCERVMFKTIEELVNKSFIEYEKKSNNGKKNYKNFFIKALIQGNYAKGFTILSNGALMGCIDQRITPTQLKLYVLLMKYGFNKGNAYPSNETLAKELDITQQGVNKMLKVLEKNGYIQRLFTYPKGVKFTNYRLLV